MGPTPTDTELDTSAPNRGVGPSLRGKSLYLGEEKLQVRGVTYGPFSSDPSGGFEPLTVQRDFALMAGCGINAVRVYSAPERWLLDLAQLHGLHVMVGIPWEQHVAFLDTGAADGIERAVARRSGPWPGTPRCFATRLATRFPPQSSAGTAASQSNASLDACAALRGMRTRVH